MKIIYIEASAEDMRANRTILDSITEALSGVSRTLAGVDLDPAAVASYMAKVEEEEKDDEQQTESETLQAAIRKDFSSKILSRSDPSRVLKAVQSERRIFS